MLQRGQCYAHKNHTKYYEIQSIFDNKVFFIYYDSKTNKEDYANRSINEFEYLIKNGILLRD